MINPDMKVKDAILLIEHQIAGEDMPLRTSREKPKHDILLITRAHASELR
jgi:hypothetical protein